MQEDYADEALCVGEEVHRLKQASEERMQELKLSLGAATQYACRTSPPSFLHTRNS